MTRFGAVPALVYLRLATAAGQLRSRLRRLKQPKYLVGAVIGLAYVYGFFLRRIPLGAGPGVAAAPAPAAQTEIASIFPEIAAAVLLLLLALNWILPRGRAGLPFSEPEIAFLFPAPVSRRGLIHYKLIGSLLALLLTSLIITLVSMRWSLLASSAWTRAVGWWLVLATMSLHTTASSFVITRWLDRGVASLTRSLAALGVLTAVICGSLVWTFMALPAPAAIADVPAAARYLTAALQTGPLPWLLAVPRLTVAPLLARDTPTFALALGPALGVLAAHYAWVLYSAVAFEDVSIAKAEKRAARVAALRSGTLRAAPQSASKQPDPFRLGDGGWPELAFLWKNLLAMGRLFRPRSALVAAAIIAVTCTWLAASPRYRTAQGLVQLGALATVLLVTLLGPRIVRHDLRADLKNADILKTYPLRGAQIVLAELLAPIAVLSAIAWLGLLAFALALPPEARATLPPFVFPAGVLGAATLVPVFCAIQLVLENGVALLFPAWMAAVSNRAEHGL
ncbi:MAG TPA: putative ABC exporter domain-containing protein, partial [Gammaproteobacteria bacterium]|nr:putative ABC exporter domain-containing protein [Gammaproteobacteria bacterium]